MVERKLGGQGFVRRNTKNNLELNYPTSTNGQSRRSVAAANSTIKNSLQHILAH